MICYLSRVSNGLQLLTQRCLWCLAISEIINVPELSLSCLPVSHLNCCSVFCFCSFFFFFCILLAISSFHHSSSFILGLILPSLSFLATHLHPIFCQIPLDGIFETPDCFAFRNSMLLLAFNISYLNCYDDF